MADSNYNPALKKCSACGELKLATIEFFHPNVGGKYGLRGQCRLCHLARVRELIKKPARAASRKAQAVRYVANGKNASINREWRARNLEKARQSTAAWQIRNPDRVRVGQKAWRDANPEKVRAKQRRADAIAQQKPIHVLNRRVKGRIREMLRGKFAVGQIGRYLNFTKDELVAHIERQFTDGMTWERLIAGEIHIDHIVPISTFRIMEIGDSEFMACWSLGNLRPLWAIDNWRKKNKVITLL